MKTFIWLLLCAILLAGMVRCADAGEFYIQGAVGYHDRGYDSCSDVSWCSAAPHLGDTLGQFVLGNRWDNEIYVEFQHTSGLQDSDRGLNAVFIGVRKEWSY